MAKYNGQEYKIGMITKVILSHGIVNMLVGHNIKADTYYKIRAYRRVKEPKDGCSGFLIYLEGPNNEYLPRGFAAERFESPIYDTPAARLLYEKA